MNEASAPDTDPLAPVAASDRGGSFRPVTIALMGPTASGKTDLALKLAEALDLTVLSVDSRQLYRGMDVGTAKPTPAQRRRVRHELLDLRDPDQPINLQTFTTLAKAAIALTERRTRQYAKRQRTWFRRRHSPLWLGQRRLDSGQESGSNSSAAEVSDDLLRETLELTQHVLG